MSPYIDAMSLDESKQQFAKVLFHNYLPPSGEQPEPCISPHKLEQPTSGCKAIFQKYCCYTKHGARGIITNLTEILGYRYITN